jgi:uncharacterized protein (TIGR01244 family)
MKRIQYLYSLLVLAVLAASCAVGESQNTAPVGAAVRLEGWEGINNLFRDGSIYFGGQPDEATFRRLADEAGIKTVVNIRESSEMSRLGFDEPALVGELGMEYRTIPFTPQSFSARDVDRLAEILAGTDEPVLIHCGSSNRIGGLWAAYLKNHRGYEIEEAIEYGKAAGLRRTSMIDAVMKVTRDH